MVRTKTLLILIFSAQPLLFNCSMLYARAGGKDEQRTAYDFYLSGNTSYNNAEYDKAVSAFRRSVELDPSYCYAHINLGVSLAQIGEFEQAIREFTFCIDKKYGCGSDRFVFHFNRALSRKANGETKSAQRDWAILKRLDPARAEELENSKEHILMDSVYLERRNQADRNKLYEQYKRSITKGKIVVRKVLGTAMNTREYEAMGLIEGTVEEISSVLSDYESYPEFMPNVDEIAVRSSTDEEFIVDWKLALPLGLVKRYRLRCWSRGEENRIQRFWKKLPWPGLRPKEAIVDAYGQWILESLPERENHVLAYYRMYTDPGQMPLGTGWIINILTKRSVPDIIRNTRSRVKSVHHEPRGTRPR
jgi:tetratricopeptide (TPR) repeat protein